MNLSRLTIIILLFSNQLIAQSLTNSFNQMMNNAETYKDYKVIKATDLNSFWNSVEDSLTFHREQIVGLHLDRSQLESELDKLHSSNQSINELLIVSEYERSHIGVMGIDLRKEMFITMVIIITIGLLALVGFIVIRLRLQQQEVKSALTDRQQLETKFEEYRRDALKMQMNLRRELQTERNILEKIKGSN